MSPYLSLRPHSLDDRVNQKRKHPLQDPLNYGALADFAEFFETLAKFKTWLRKHKTRRKSNLRRAQIGNQTVLKSIIQN